ncbi:hypothetical protein V5799_013434 [Amblyomma americanum]|uniref:Schwannomin interacting protein 1 C-terminal domain-containing protein n=1 Tax=Amblyomma americanum TaxID=6943 RepID=A0AAQ4E5X0_AMBAM
MKMSRKTRRRIDAGRSFLPASMRYDVIRQHDYGGAGMSSRNLELDPPSNSAYSDDEDTSEEEWQEPKRAEEVKCRSEDEWNFFDNIVQLLGDADTVERRNDREAIRQKLAMDTDVEESFGIERANRKPSLAVRLQESKNLQICFMNETAAELDSLELAGATAQPQDDGSSRQSASQQGNANTSSVGLPNGLLNAGSDISLLQTSTKPSQNATPATRRGSQEEAAPKRPSFFFNRRKSWRQKKADGGNGEAKKESSSERWNGEDFATRQARLQAEARAALAQAKEMARMQMEVERQQKKKSPIADIVGISFPDSRHRLSRQLLNDMNVAQLQVIVNDLHSQIESHNEDLVKFLLERDDLHMEQDSMLVDIEDMTRYLGAKNMTASHDGSSVSLPHPAKTIPSK